ncbi:MAG: MerR family transcriptional regulator, partial [Rhodobacteraceae bacterium]
MDKSPDAFRTISEVAEWLGVPAHVLRFWESKFTQVKPVKRAGGRRYYRPADMALLGGIKALLHDDGMTIKGVQKLLREKGVAHVAGFAPAFDPEAGPVDASERPAARVRRVAENVVPFQAREEAEEQDPDQEPDTA